jgi:prepilin-type N-terminal cleavage/methylation domain-containing protein
MNLLRIEDLKLKINAGFTLVELMIVILIIAILATIAIMSFQGQIFKGNDAKRKADINRIKIAVEEYEKDYNCYPPKGLVVCTNGGTGLQPYLNKIPCDPTTNTSYYYDNDGSVCPSWYRFYAKLQNTQDPQINSGIGPDGQYNFYLGSPNAPTPSSTSTPSPTSGFVNSVPTGYWGCFSGQCLPIKLNPSGNPACSPSYPNQCINSNNCAFECQ